MQTKLEDMLDCLLEAKKLLAHGFFPHFTKGIERLNGEVRHVVYAGSRFHPEVHEWAVDDAIRRGAKRRVGVSISVQEYFRPLTGDFYSVMQYSLAPGRTQAEMLALFSKAIDKVRASIKAGHVVYDSASNRIYRSESP